MKTKALVWDQVDKAQIPLGRLIEEYLLVCRTEGKTPKTLRGYREKLRRFCRWLNGNLGDFTLQAVRAYVGELQRARKYEGHPYSPVQDTGLSSLTIKGHAVVLKGFATLSPVYINRLGGSVYIWISQPRLRKKRKPSRHKTKIIMPTVKAFLPPCKGVWQRTLPQG